MLHSQIATASDLALLRSSVSRPYEIVLHYARNFLSNPTPLFSKLMSDFGDLEGLKRHFEFATKAEVQLGDWCSDRVWQLAMTSDSFFKLERLVAKQFRKDQENIPVSLLDSELAKLANVRDLILQREFPNPNLDNPSDVSPKAKLLVQFLHQEFNTEKQSRGLILVRERWTGKLLCELLRHVGPHHLRPDVLMGHRSGDAGEETISFRKQLGILNNFRKGEINCLVATSIAEEGLDIPECNLVIRFDLYDTLIQYIQSRGRARHAQSQYVHMIEIGNTDQEKQLGEIRRAEARTRAFCEALPSDRLLQGNGADPDFDSTISKEKGHRRYTVPETGATLTYASSMVFLDHFASSLPTTGNEQQR